MIKQTQSTVNEALKQIFENRLPICLRLLEAKQNDTREMTKIRTSLSVAMTYRAIARIEGESEASLSKAWSLLVGLLLSVKIENQGDIALNRSLWQLIKDPRRF